MSFPAGSIPGIDVSYVQKSVDWAAAAAAGERFAMSKASEGGHADPTFVDHWRGAKQAGLLRGAYHFFRSQVDAKAQAETFLAQLQLANGVTQLQPGDLPAALDVEATNGASQADMVKGVQTWLDLVQAATGRVPFVYTAKYFWEQSVGNTPQFGKYPLWVANYTVAAEPKIPSSWKTWAIWQFGTQAVPGIHAPVDVNAFHGTMADLQKLAGM